MSDVAEIVAAVNAVVEARMARFEEVVRGQFLDLKKDHLERIERDLRAENLRLWEEIDKLKTWKNQHAGGTRAFGTVGTFLSGGVGAVIGALITALTSSKPPSLH